MVVDAYGTLSLYLTFLVAKFHTQRQPLCRMAGGTGIRSVLYERLSSLGLTTLAI